ncbi:MAG: gliding motility-associated C-terminal domain-containing protein [Sphingobacteriales bacterium]|nr:MAG: gliding motility-associated C-terminal domain-containing protein [Sphingobacteriales bacterium]
MVFDYGSQDSFYVKLYLTNQLCTDSFGQWIKILNLREDIDTARIILATVENNQHIKIYWQKLNLAKQYLLQRSENGSDFKYWNYTTDTLFTDQLADVQNKSYYYKITGIDDCGGRSAASPASRTILLQAKVIGEEDAAELSWNKYEGFGENTKHNLLKENNLAYSTSTENAFTDIDYFDENLLQRFYVMEAENQAKTLKSLSNEVCINYKPRIYIPNAFSPNNDAINETFQVKTTGIISYEIKIYNRWGELIFSGNQSSKNWDGKFKNATATEGVYFYVFSGKDITGKGFYRNGNVNVIR